MPDMTLTPTSAFSNPNPTPSSAIAIETVDDLMIVAITPHRGRADEVTEVLKNNHGVEAPRKPAASSGGDITLLWAGPDQWLAIAKRVESRNLESELKAALSGLAAVVDHSDGRAVIKVSGQQARNALAKGFSIDLHPRTFNVNGVAITQASHIGAVIWQTNDEPTYMIAVFRSFADSFADWLHHAAVEYTSA